MAKKKSKSAAQVSAEIGERTYVPDPLTDLQPVASDYDVLDDPEIVEHPAEFVGGSQALRVATIDDEAATDADDRPSIKDIFGPGGMLKQCMPQGYEHRRSQLEMATILEKSTATGDRAELNFLPDDAELWHRLDARREACTGQKCPEFGNCFVTLMHQRAADADVVIVNHHLFFADLALRQDDFGSILPEY